MTTTRSIDPLVWIDCEMTGLDPIRDCILQICCYVTDSNLNLIDEEGWETIIHQPKSTLDAMDEWCTRTHASTGLTSAVLASSVTEEEAADGLLAYIQRFVPESRKGLLAGNSVHADKAFLARPPFLRVIQHLHYRIFDVSSIKEGVRRWASDELLENIPRKKGLHEARADVLESIEEARYYKTRFLSI